MRLFAIETNVEELKKKFIVENEEAVHVIHKHFLVFIIRAFVPTVVFLAVFGLLSFGAVQSILAPDISFWILLVAGTIYAYFLSAAHIAWRYNFIIITTQKVVIVDQFSMFYQRIQPVHFHNINNTRPESQFAGIFRCGILHIDMKISELGGQHVEIFSAYVPKPSDVSAIIEHGIVMSEKPIKQKEEHEKQHAMQEPAKNSGNRQPDVLKEDQPPEGIGIGKAIAGESPPPEKP